MRSVGVLRRRFRTPGRWPRREVARTKKPIHAAGDRKIALERQTQERQSAVGPPLGTEGHLNVRLASSESPYKCLKEGCAVMGLVVLLYYAAFSSRFPYRSYSLIYFPASVTIDDASSRDGKLFDAVMA